MVELVSNAGDGHVRRWKTSLYMPVHGIVALAGKHGRDARGPDGFTAERIRSLSSINT